MTADQVIPILDVTQAQPVRYCVELWQRDAQIKLAMERVKARIQEKLVPRPESAAIVCYGPSLAETWEQVKDFEFIFSCSGSHKFLLERDIVPTYHVEVDPRPHKTLLIGPPHKDVEYLIASACSPAVFDLLEGFDVKLWHIFSNEAEALRTLPHGEWAITGGSSVGLRTMTIARFFGFVNQHVFGMDGCEGATGKHAAAHPNQPKGHAQVEYEGKTYLTTPSMLECARQTWHELDQMPDVKATFYGEGLVQHMARHYVPKPAPKVAAIGMSKPELISAEYRDLNIKLHRENLAYGVSGSRHVVTVLKLAKTLKTKNILDYGCGKGELGKKIPWAIAEYDPAIAGKEESPKPADLVICTDVLEHIEPDRLNFVLDDLRRCVLQVGFFVVHTKAAKKVLADGRNAHLIQQGAGWWKKRLEKLFNVGSIIERGPELYIVVGPRVATKPASVKLSVAVVEEAHS